MKLVIAGGTGFIGSALCPALLRGGHALTLLSRRESAAGASANMNRVRWDPGTPGLWESTVDGADGVINLAGEPIAAKRWTQAQKEKLRSSRVNTTRALVGAIGKAEQKPKFLINGSAIGYYGARGDEMLSENAEPGTDFLATICREWEGEAIKAEAYGLRVVRLRTGIVLGKGGGALAKMVPPFKFFAGGPLGTGRQWMSWIHLDDEVGLILFLAGNAAARGAVNATASNPVTNRDFCKTLGSVLGRPCWAPVPSFALRVMLGEMADMLVTGQRVIPTEAQRLGYRFGYPALRQALEACMPL